MRSNTAIDYHAKEKNLCSTAKGDFYDFKYGRIYYTRQGQGAPLILLHNLDTNSSGYEVQDSEKIRKGSHRIHTGSSRMRQIRQAITYLYEFFVCAVADLLCPGCDR